MYIYIFVCLSTAYCISEIEGVKSLLDRLPDQEIGSVSFRACVRACDAKLHGPAGR